MTSVSTGVGGTNVAATIVLTVPGRLCSLQAYTFLARCHSIVEPHAAVFSYMLRWLKAHLYPTVMLLAPGAGMVPFGSVRFSCELLCVMPDCSEDEETNLDLLNTDASGALDSVGKKDLAHSFLLLNYHIFLLF